MDINKTTSKGDIQNVIGVNVEMVLENVMEHLLTDEMPNTECRALGSFGPRPPGNKYIVASHETVRRSDAYIDR